jgi:DNA-directed RNA polymerase
MKQIAINRLSEGIEDRTRTKGVRNSVAAVYFRDAGCIYNDFRTERIVSDTIQLLIHTFSRSDGVAKLTATSIKIGNIVKKVLGIDNDSKAISIKLGDFILSEFVSQHYLNLEKEAFFCIEEVYAQGKKTQFGHNPYLLTIGPEFPEVTIKPKLRTGMSMKKYAHYSDGKRMVEGVLEHMGRGVMNFKGTEETQFFKSLNKLESVKWSINSRVAEISKALKEDLTCRYMTVQDFDGNDCQFDVYDIQRGYKNKHLNGVDIYFNEDMFEPHKGNSTIIPILEKEIAALTKRLSKLKNKGKIQETKDKLHLVHKRYDSESQKWTDKQYCLRRQSVSSRNKAIIETVHGTDTEPGWLGYGFYQSMFLDYRGRIYNTDPFFSYQSNDLARGHFVFAEEKELDQKGVEYTFIHAACSFNASYCLKQLPDMIWLENDYAKELRKDGLMDISVDKMSVNDKHNWTVENIDMLLDIAENPLDHVELWMSAEKPWVFLSLCFEVGGIVGAALTGEPYMSGMPVAIDGVNNGTQHLAAMSKDEMAGKLVGLTPLEIPKDFYLTIGKGMLEINKDTEIGKKLNKMPMKLVRKGISKRGSMTRAYDAGARKIGEIIYQDSYDAGIVAKYKLTRSDARSLGKDLVKVYDSVCSGPVDIKKFLQALVKHRLISMKMKDVSWVSPSGFPAVCEKFVQVKGFCKAAVNTKRIHHVYLEKTDRPATVEHLSAIGANWVHSYDAAHMSLVINKLSSSSFGAIHDSYSCHASDVQEMIDTTKEVFIDMYNVNVFDMMREFIVYGADAGIENPKYGSLDLELIRESDFFFC